MALALATGAHADSPDASMTQFIEEEMATARIPGMAYAVVVDGSVDSVAVHGVVRSGQATQVTVDTPFLTGSISKSITALAIMQQVEAGQVDLDASLSQYLDGFAGRPAGAVTVRQLLSHTSGYSTLQGNASDLRSTGERDELAGTVDALVHVNPAYEPNQRWAYSNTNYQVLGRIVEVVSGRDFQSYVAVNILEPIGMSHSFMADGERHESMAVGHTPWFGTKRPLPNDAPSLSSAPQGGLVATAGDLALFLAVMMNGEDDVLSADGKTLMMQPASATSPWYGMGWFVDEQHGRVWHSGLTPGVETLATMTPTDGRGVVVFVNAGSGMGFGETTDLLTGVTERALGLHHDGAGSRWSQKATFVGLSLLPIVYLLSMAWAWRSRTALRDKAGMGGLVSLWFPLLSTVAAAWTMLWMVPRLFGTPYANLSRYQPDLTLVLMLGGVLGVVWAVFRIGVAYTGRRNTPATS